MKGIVFAGTGQGRQSARSYVARMFCLYAAAMCVSVGLSVVW